MGGPFYDFPRSDVPYARKTRKTANRKRKWPKSIFSEVQEKSAENKSCRAWSIYGGSLLWLLSLRRTLSEKNAKNRKPETEMVETGNGNGSILENFLFWEFWYIICPRSSNQGSKLRLSNLARHGTKFILQILARHGTKVLRILARYGTVLYKGLYIRVLYIRVYIRVYTLYV